jgi:hypothetical protein
LGILKFQKWFDVEIFNFQFELCLDILALGGFLGYFFKKWVFFPKLLVTLLATIPFRRQI